MASHLRLSVRSALRQRAYTVINVVGLSVSMACCLLLLLFVRDELSFDRHHANYDRLHRVLRETRFPGQDPIVTHGTSGALPAALERDFPEVERAVRVLSAWGWLESGDTGFSRLFCLADAGILDIFSFPLVAGNRRTALSSPASVLLTETSARLHFGDADALGKTIRLEHGFMKQDFVVSGVLADLPANTSFRFDYLMTPPRGWGVGVSYWDGFQLGKWRPLQTWVLLHPDADAAQLERKLNTAAGRYLGDEAGPVNTYFVQPLSRVHLHTKTDYGISGNIHMGIAGTGEIEQVWLFGGIAFVVLLVACINFVNLATARALARTREIGVRKAIGARREQLALQFLGESTFLILLASGLALCLTKLALAEFNALVFKQLVLDGEQLLFLLPWLATLVALVAVLAGGYPALYLSSFRPVEVLKGTWRAGSVDLWLRKGLVVFQFTVSTLLLVCTGVVYYQVHYVTSRDLGLDREQQILALGVFNKNPDLMPVAQSVKAEFLEHPGVLRATLALGVIPRAALVDISVEGSPDNLSMFSVGGDEDFLGVYGIDLVAGRNIERRGDFLINETAARSLGWDDPIGHQLEWPEARNRGSVVGVMRDFHFASLHETIKPVFVAHPHFFNYLVLRLRPENLPETMAFVREVYERRAQQSFYGRFVDDSFHEFYHEEQRLGRILVSFTTLAVSVACLGMVGLASFAARRRTKEIGIRKVLGASVSSVVVLLSRDLAAFALLASLVAWPIAYWAMSEWLQNFAYRMQLGPGVFLLAGASVLAIVLLAVSVQTVRAGFGQPVEALRCE